jgi:phosphonate transport system substrate-binding protein
MAKFSCNTFLRYVQSSFCFLFVCASFLVSTVNANTTAPGLGVTPAAAPTAAPTATFTIGVVPNVSARVILTNYQPMRDYFARTLKANVEIATAADFVSFHAASQRGDYQLVITPANLGRVAQLDANLTAVASYEPPIPGLLVAGATNTNDAVDQLMGKSLALANPQSLLALTGLRWLREQGLVDGRDYTIVRAGNDDSLGTLIRTGDAPLAMMSMGEFKAISEAARKNLRIVREFAKLPSFLVMTHPNLSVELQQQIKTLVLQFPQSEEGKKFFALSGVANIRAIVPAELAALDGFVAQTRAGLVAKK